VVFIHFQDEPEGWRELLVARPSQWVLAGARWGGGGVISGAAEGSGGGTIDGLGWRGFGSRWFLVAIFTHIDGFLTVGRGVG